MSHGWLNVYHYFPITGSTGVLEGTSKKSHAQKGRISQDLSSEIARAKGTWLEVYVTAGIDPDSDFLRESPLAVPAERLGEGHGKLQRAISDMYEV